MRELPLSKTHLLTLIVFHLALYLPMIGRGLVFDDFRHVYSAAYQPLQYGLTRVQGGPFFDPLVWLAFKADWMFWGGRSFPMAAENLLVHVANILMLYFLTLRLWQSEVAAWWTALGFALLFPANTWAVMYIATRAHVIATFFYLGALIAAWWYVHGALRHQVMAGIIVVACAGLSVFAKESGITVVAAVFIMLAHERQSLKRKVFSRGDILLFIGLVGLLAVYLGLRSQSGAISPSAPDDTYNYALSLRRLANNLLRYAWRTYGLLAIVAFAITVSQYLRGVRPHKLLTTRDVFLSMMLFAVTSGPFLLLSVRSATYSYLPGIGAALLLGAVARSLYAAPTIPRSFPTVLASFPIILVVASLIGFTIGQSLKWVRMGDVSRAVLDQIAAQQPQVKPNTSVVLKYSEVDREHRFPDAFAGGVFTYAVRLLYRDPSLDGKIIRHGEPYSIGETSSEIEFEYIVINQKPTIRMVSKN